MPPTFLQRFLRDEDGAVTVDWVVLTAAIMTLGALMAAYVITGSTSLSASAGASLANAQVPAIDFNKVD
jgi:Flp pilus assembly pilin Flp